MPPKALKRISDTIWELPSSYLPGMRVPVRIYATPELLASMDEGVFEQSANVACLPGIQGYSFCMPDGHRGYGFPIGGVAAFDLEEGVISPGGIGFDINCGMRLVSTSLTLAEVQPRLQELVDRLFQRIPAGVGARGSMALSKKELKDLAEQGMKWCLKKGYAVQEDLDRTEEGGCVEGAEVSRVSERALERGLNQVGTLGSGNHYLEIQVAKAENVFDPRAAEILGIRLPDQVLIMFHCGSRGFGHQIATDYLQQFLKVIKVRDRELACAPFRSGEGQAYFAAMKCAVNLAFVNRQMILYNLRRVFSEVFGKDPFDLGLHQVYDVTHNTTRLERHRLGDGMRELVVHRKGATQALGPGMEGIPPEYREIGQPVIIGGSMETGSYLLTGAQSAEATFYTTAHGSGRTMGRNEAKRRFRGKDLEEKLRRKGIYLRTASYSGLAEEAGAAYKNIDQVVEATERAGLSRRVARLLPIGNIKG